MILPMAPAAGPSPRVAMLGRQQLALGGRRDEQKRWPVALTRGTYPLGVGNQREDQGHAVGDKIENRRAGDGKNQR